MTKHLEKVDGVDRIVRNLKHFLPAQASLKDFIHHNTLHSFQTEKFFDGIMKASAILGYKVSLSLSEYRKMYDEGRISDQAVQKVLEEYVPEEKDEIRNQMLFSMLDYEFEPRIGKLRANWKKICHIDLDSLVHPVLFRLLCSYLDQGISIWNFPLGHLSLLSSVREMERISSISFFRTEKARRLLLNQNTTTEHLLELLVGDPAWFEQYLFDQQFTHPGWSGMVPVIEDMPETLLDQRRFH